MSDERNPDPIRALLEDRVREGWMPGAAWVVAGSRGTISRGTAGDAQTEPHRDPAVESTPFDLASLTKPLATGILLALFENDGRLDPLAPVEDYLESLQGSNWGKPSSLAFATHVTGMPAWEPLYLDASDLDGYVERIARLDPAGAAGAPLYSDLGYIVLGAMLERVGGASLDELFASRIARPLGLLATGFARAPAQVRGAAATERGNAFERRLAAPRGSDFAWRTSVIRGEVHDGNAWRLQGVAGHAGLFGTADEVATIARRILDAEEPFGPRVRERLFVEHAGSRRTAGMVVAAGSDAARGVLPDDAPGHTGFTGTSVWIEPNGGEVYVLLTNRVHPVVPDRDFQTLRSEFHRLARGLADADRRPVS